MGIEFIISNNTIVLGQRKEQSGALSSPRGPAGRGRQADERAPGTRSGARSWLARRRLRLPGSGRGGRGGRGRPGEGCGTGQPASRRGCAGRGVAALSFDLLLFAAIPRGLPQGLDVYSPPSQPPASKRLLNSGSNGHKGDRARLAERGLPHPAAARTPAPWAQSQLSSQPSTDKRGFRSSLPWSPPSSKRPH